jgi:hypothetical protein
VTEHSSFAAFFFRGCYQLSPGAKANDRVETHLKSILAIIPLSSWLSR